MSPFLFLIVLTAIASCNCVMFIDNFEERGPPSAWVELSDTMMKGGQSKSSFVVQKSRSFSRAVLFTMLNPRKCGAALAGVKKDVKLDLTEYTTISLKLRGQGQYVGYEFFLRHKGQTTGVPAYVHYFVAPPNFKIVKLKISNFTPYLNGKFVPDAEPLDQRQITTLGILAYGGAHMKNKQSGVAALEIDWIKLE